MTKEEILKIAQEYDLIANNAEHGITLMGIVNFAKLIANYEREQCAKMCDFVYDNIVTDEHIKDMAFKIRARGQE